MNKKRVLIVLFLGILLSSFVACATMQPSEKPYRVTPKGTVVYGGEFEFELPPAGWGLFWPEGDEEFAFGFIRKDPGPFPSQSVFAYDEEPFGSSRDFDERATEFLKRFLWNSNLQFKVLEKKKVQAPGGEGLAVMVEGKDPVRKEKAKSKLIFLKRGERVVSFYLTQWREIDGTYEPSAFEVFDKFVSSFRYLKKSFYETL